MHIRSLTIHNKHPQLLPQVIFLKGMREVREWTDVGSNENQHVIGESRAFAEDA